jgi:hypothetical protein
MHLRSMLAATLALALAATGAWAQTYTLKVREFPAPGKSIQASNSSKTNTSVKVSQGAMVVMEEKKTEIEESEYAEKVLAGGDERPEKYTRTYAKALKGDPANVVKQFQQGKTILFERKGDKYLATVDGVMPKDPEGIKALQDLAKLASDSKDPFGKVMLPREAVAVGGTWTVPGKQVLANLPEFKDTDPDTIKTQGKLVKVYKKDGQQWGTLEFTIDLPLKNLGPGLVLSKAIPLQFKGTMDAVIDGSSTAATITGSATVKGSSEFTQNNMTFTLDLTLDGEFRMQRSAEK